MSVLELALEVEPRGEVVSMVLTDRHTVVSMLPETGRRAY